MVSVSPNVYVPLDRGMSLLQLSAGSFLSKKVCSRLHQIEVDFYTKKGKVRFLSHPLGDLFSLALTVETLQAEICRRERF